MLRAPTRESFGTTAGGEAVSVYTLKNAHGMELRAIDLGGIIVSLKVPDRNGHFDDVVLGFDSLAEYERNVPHFGAIIGRHAGRIAGGCFTLDGRDYTLARNDGPHHLHGGVKGFHKVLWEVAPFAHRDSTGLVFRYTSPHGEEGYPGTLRTTVTYTLTNRNELIFDFHATTDRATRVNLTQHSYFNLAGHGTSGIHGHVVTLDADRFIPMDDTLIPTGAPRSVEGTPFDFRVPTSIGARIDQDDEQLRHGRGYDHAFVLNKGGERAPAFAARVLEPSSGRVMEIYTTEPGLVFYTGNFLDGTARGKGGIVYRQRAGFAMETQRFVTTLRTGEEHRSRTIYAFSVQP